MEQKRCIVVAGPERSGTRLVTRILIAAGCEGHAGAAPKTEHAAWPQKWDAQDPPAGVLRIVIRRTLPYHPDRTWPDLPALCERFTGLGYQVRLVTVSRNREIVARSQLREGMEPDVRTARAAVARAYRILGDIERLPALKGLCHRIRYEELVSRPLYEVQRLCWAMGLPALSFIPEPIYNGNAAYRQRAFSGGGVSGVRRSGRTLVEGQP